VIFRRKKQEEDEGPQEQIEYVLFQGPLNGNTPDLRANAKLVQAALIPTKELVTDAILRRAEMIRLDPKGPAALVRLYVDGVPYPAARMPRQQGVGVTQMIKLLAGLDIKERGKVQSGGLNAEHEGIKYELRVQAAPGEGAERLIVRVENLKTRPEKPDELGFSQPMRDKLRELTDEHSGALLCCGPPMSGLTATTFGVLRSLDPYTRTITSLGDTEGRKLIAIGEFERLSSTWTRSATPTTPGWSSNSPTWSPSSPSSPRRTSPRACSSLSSGPATRTSSPRACADSSVPS
jgi:type IV pilus assembly protein PilB